MNERSRKTLTRCNFALFLSVAAPEAGPRELRTIVDWGNWVCGRETSEINISS